MSLAVLFHFLCPQHVSDINISIIRSLRLCCWITTSVVMFLVRCVLEIRCGWVGGVSVLQAEAQLLCFSLQHCRPVYVHIDPAYNHCTNLPSLLSNICKYWPSPPSNVRTYWASLCSNICTCWLSLCSNICTRWPSLSSSVNKYWHNLSSSSHVNSRLLNLVSFVSFFLT